jgi:hypothetical protein
MGNKSNGYAISSENNKMQEVQEDRGSEVGRQHPCGNTIL